MKITVRTGPEDGPEIVADTIRELFAIGEMIRSSSVTPIFPHTVKPVHVGLYACRVPDGGTQLFYWSGKHWKVHPDTSWICANQNLPWYGLTTEAKQ